MSEIQHQKFTPYSFESWKLQAEKELKGVPFEKLSITTEEGIVLEPFYSRANVSHPIAAVSKSNNGNNWYINTVYATISAEALNQYVLSDLNQGVEAITLPATALAWDIALKGVELPYLYTSLNTHFDTTLANQWATWLLQNYESETGLKGCLGLDALAMLHQNGHEAVAAVWLKIQSHFPNFHVAEINTVALFEAGAQLDTEIAALWRTLQLAANALISEHIPPSHFFKGIRLSVATGTKLYLHTTRLKAIKLLWNEMLLQYNLTEEDCPLFLAATTAKREWSEIDVQNNLLRQTLATTAAILGGANCITTPAYTQLTDQLASAQRLSNNIQLLLKNESYLNTIADPTAGSYFLDHLTYEWVNTIHAKLHLLYASTLTWYAQVQAWVKAEAQQRNLEYNQGKLTTVGVNAFPAFEIPELTLATNENLNAWDVNPINNTHDLELFRLKVVHYKMPPITLITTGNAAKRMARVQFIKNFIGVAGFNTQEIPLDQTPQALPFAILCADDESYSSENIQKLLDLKIKYLFIAGLPENNKALLTLGVNGFIHIKSPLLATLKLIFTLLTNPDEHA